MTLPQTKILNGLVSQVGYILIMIHPELRIIQILWEDYLARHQQGFNSESIGHLSCCILTRSKDSSYSILAACNVKNFSLKLFELVEHLHDRPLFLGPSDQPAFQELVNCEIVKLKFGVSSRKTFFSSG